MVVSVGAGFPINWQLPSNAQFRLHPLYIKYSSSTFADIDVDAVRTDLGSVLATADSSEVCAYLSWLIRTLTLLTPA